METDNDKWPLPSNQSAYLAEALTAVTTFTIDDPVQRLLEILREQPQILMAAVWKIKRRSKTLCLKGFSCDGMKLNPLATEHATFYVASYADSALNKAFQEPGFRQGKPIVISDPLTLSDDPFWKHLTPLRTQARNDVYCLPIVNYKRETSLNPSYFLIIVLDKRFRFDSIDPHLLQAIANRASTTLSSQVEKKLNTITSFVKELVAHRAASEGLSGILRGVMTDLIPRHFNAFQAILIWRSPHSQRYHLLFNNRANTPTGHVDQNTVDQIAAECLDRIETPQVLFERDNFLSIPHFPRVFRTVIAAPIRSHGPIDKPNGFLILIDKINPLALRAVPPAQIPDYFDWEDEHLMEHTASMLNLLAELTQADNRRKQLADQIAHEIIMPANYIIGTTDELLDDDLDIPDQKRKSQMANIRTFAHLQLALCNGILLGLQDLDIPPKDRYQPEQVNLYSLASEVATLVFPFCQRKKVRNDNIVPARNLPALFIDRTAFLQVFLNLISNAIKYKGDAAFNEFHVDISCDFAQISQVPESAMRAHYARWRDRPQYLKEPRMSQGYIITVEDGGIGIQRGHEERVFQRYFRVPGVEKWEARGSGLGLAIVRKIVSDHFGAIWLDNSRNPTRFAIYLPIRLATTEYTRDPFWKGEIQ